MRSTFVKIAIIAEIAERANGVLTALIALLLLHFAIAQALKMIKYTDHLRMALHQYLDLK